MLIEQGLKLRQENANQEREFRTEELNERHLATNSLAQMMEGQQTLMQNKMHQRQQFMMQMQEIQLQTLAIINGVVNTVKSNKND